MFMMNSKVTSMFSRYDEDFIVLVFMMMVNFIVTSMKFNDDEFHILI